MNSVSQPSRPKARFHIRLEEGDYLSITVWLGKKEPEAEVITAQIRRLEGDDWRTVGRLAVYRTPDGTYSQLPERQRPS